MQHSGPASKLMYPGQEAEAGVALAAKLIRKMIWMNLGEDAFQMGRGIFKKKLGFPQMIHITTPESFHVCTHTAQVACWRKWAPVVHSGSHAIGLC